MAKLAYCEVCKATYPLIVVMGTAGRGGKEKEPVCPMGHSQVHEVDSSQ